MNTDTLKIIAEVSGSQILQSFLSLTASMLCIAIFPPMRMFEGAILKKLKRQHVHPYKYKIKCRWLTVLFSIMVALYFYFDTWNVLDTGTALMYGISGGFITGIAAYLFARKVLKDSNFMRYLLLASIFFLLPLILKLIHWIGSMF